MRSFFSAVCADRYEFVKVEDDRDYEIFHRLDGTPQGARWKPVRVRVVDEEEGEGPLLRSDFPWLGGHALVMRRRTVDALRDLLEPNGELLSLDSADGDGMFVFNSKTIDALDEARSTITKFAGTNRILRLTTPVFVSAAVDGVDVFRLPYRGLRTFYSDRFVQRVHEKRLRGLEFRKEWSG